ncbi:MAG: pentapeptide repeat-containing protein [Vampirovibrionales bacterium]
MRLTSLSNPTYSTPHMAGLQAQASTANMAQAQKAEAFTSSGRIQRQGFATAEQVGLAIKAIETHLKELTEKSELWGRVQVVFRGEFGHTPQQAFQTHKANLQAQLETLQGQLISKKYTGQGAYLVGLDLIGADLFGAQLQGAQLQGTQLDWANLGWTDLRGADFQNASLRGVNLNSASLKLVKSLVDPLRGTNLEGAFGLVDGLTPEMLATARNTKVLEDFRTRPSVNTLFEIYGDLEERRQAKVRALLGLG